MAAQKRAKPSRLTNARSGRKLVTTTYRRRSNFLPPINRGSSTYRETTYASSPLAPARPSPLCAPPAYDAFAHRFVCCSELIRKIPLPCALPVGFMIHVGCFRRPRRAERSRDAFREATPRPLVARGRAADSASSSSFAVGSEASVSFLKASAKSAYSPGRVNVAGRKSTALEAFRDATAGSSPARIASRSRSFRYLFTFFTSKSFRVSS